MKLTVIGSNSQGNAYLLENDREALLIECGVRFDKIKQAAKFNLKKIVGCIVSHEHLDHSKSIKEVLDAGISVYASKGTHDARCTSAHHRAHFIESGKQKPIGKFQVKAFDIKHDAAEPLGFIINHPECGNVLFLTDSYYCEYTFPGLNNIIVEANYCDTILQRRLDAGANPKFLRDRVIQSHMSLKTCKELLQANDLSQVNNIVLIHLSDGNSDEIRFKKEVEEATGKCVHVASAGYVIDPFNKQPF
ncbi:MAG: MBL fold metallo-hydrolase [Agriterribacter sp.]